MTIQKGIKPKSFIYPKALLAVVISPSVETSAAKTILEKIKETILKSYKRWDIMDKQELN